MGKLSGVMDIQAAPLDNDYASTPFRMTKKIEMNLNTRAFKNSSAIP